jgi:hypothetical protein
LPVNFSVQELRPILLKAGNRFSGKLRSVFVVLDDDVKVRREATEIPGSGSRSGVAPTEDIEDNLEEVQSVEEVQSGSGVRSGRSRSNKRGPESSIENRSKR